jgi:hypothetical protein
MKAAALAFVLLIGAAIVLAFANTLNSWVLGGLIGGLAAILLSIPISLALFTILARRHDEQLYAQGQEQEDEMVFDDEEFAEVYEADAYILPAEDEQYSGLQERRISERRNIGAPSYPRLPAAGQSHAQSSAKSMYNQRSLSYPQGTQRPSQAQSAQGNGARTPAQRLSPDRAIPYTRSQPNSLSKHQTAALRAARREANRELNMDQDDIPTSTSMSRRLPARSSQPLNGRPNAGGLSRPTRQLSRQEIFSDKPQRSIDASTKRQQTSQRRYRPIDDEHASNRYPQTDSLRTRETETDRLRGRLEQTEPLRRNPETGNITRNPQLGERPRNPDAITGSLKNPLVRRPPYMYEDDPLRQELSQFVERPIVRRSSLKESWVEEQED